jgi:hypothetical protein
LSTHQCTHNSLCRCWLCISILAPSGLQGVKLPHPSLYTQQSLPVLAVYLHLGPFRPARGQKLPHPSVYTQQSLPMLAVYLHLGPFQPARGQKLPHPSVYTQQSLPMLAVYLHLDPSRPASYFTTAVLHAAFPCQPSNTLPTLYIELALGFLVLYGNIIVYSNIAAFFGCSI